MQHISTLTCSRQIRSINSTFLKRNPDFLSTEPDLSVKISINWLNNTILEVFRSHTPKKGLKNNSIDWTKHTKQYLQFKRVLTMGTTEEKCTKTGKRLRKLTNDAMCTRKRLLNYKRNAGGGRKYNTWPNTFQSQVTRTCHLSRDAVSLFFCRSGDYRIPRMLRSVAKRPGTHQSNTQDIKKISGDLEARLWQTWDLWK